jgi:uncharacterized protein
MFLGLGMHPGPLLAYLMADPELSLQSILMVAAVIGRAKTASYVGLVALFSIIAGLLYGAWSDGVAPFGLALALATFATVLALALVWLYHRQHKAMQVSSSEENRHADNQDSGPGLRQLPQA